MIQKNSLYEGVFGVLDSGVGGLTVLKNLVKAFPRSSFVYIADRAYAPYGARPDHEILMRTKTLIKKLLCHGVDGIVNACHTSSSLLYGDTDFFQKVQVPIVTTIEPTIELIMRHKWQGAGGIFATPVSARRDILRQILKKKQFFLPMHMIGCPLLVPFIETMNWKEAEKALHIYEEEAEKWGIKEVIYGCTHYPLLTSAKIRPRSLGILDPSEAVVDHVIGTMDAQEKRIKHGHFEKKEGGKIEKERCIKDAQEAEGEKNLEKGGFEEALQMRGAQEEKGSISFSQEVEVVQKESDRINCDQERVSIHFLETLRSEGERGESLKSFLTILGMGHHKMTYEEIWIQ